MRNEGCEPSVVTYNSLIEAAIKKGNISEAEGWVGEMRREGVQCNFGTFYALVEAMVQQGEVKVLHIK